MTYDITTYNGEKDLLDIRLNMLYPYVDKFVIIEFDKTFSGKSKPKYLLKDWNKEWEKFLPKIDYAYITYNEYSKYEDLADTSHLVPKNGPKHWKREFCQKESIKDTIRGLDDEDMCFIGDVDEIWYHNVKYPNHLSKLKLKVYSYYLNNRSNEEFWGTLVGPYKYIKNQCLNHLRNDPGFRTKEYSGWHFTSMGGFNKVKEKLTDSYTNDSYANDWVLNNLENNIDNNKDFLGRNFTYEINESEWPHYLKLNKDKYKHLLRP